MPIAVLVTMTCRPGHEEELRRRLTDVIADVRTEPGNLLALVLRDPAQPDKLFEFAVYKDQAAIEAHRRARHSLTKGPAVVALQDGAWRSHYFEAVDWPESEASMA